MNNQLDYETMKLSLENMTAKERQITMIFYLKDIKDTLQEILSESRIK